MSPSPTETLSPGNTGPSFRVPLEIRDFGGDLVSGLERHTRRRATLPWKPEGVCWASWDGGTDHGPGVRQQLSRGSAERRPGPSPSAGTSAGVGLVPKGRDALREVPVPQTRGLLAASRVTGDSAPGRARGKGALGADGTGPLRPEASHPLAVSSSPGTQTELPEAPAAQARFHRKSACWFHFYRFPPGKDLPQPRPGSFWDS